MALPSYVTGQVLAASDCNLWFIPLAVVKPSDQSVTSSTVLVNDTALVLPVAINSTYELDLEIFWTPVAGGATPGIAWSLNTPAGCSGEFRVMATSSILVGVYNSTSTGWNAASVGTYSPLSFHGTLVVGATSGNLQFQFAQSTSSATSTTVKANSFMKLQRIA